MAGTIRVRYDPVKGLVQEKGDAGVEFGSYVQLEYVRETTIRVTGSFTMTNQAFIAVDASGGARTITLPAAASLESGRVVTVKKMDSSSNSVTVQPVSATIDGGASAIILAPWASLTIEAQAGSWFIR